MRLNFTLNPTSDHTSCCWLILFQCHFFTVQESVRKHVNPSRLFLGQDDFPPHEVLTIYSGQLFVVLPTRLSVRGAAIHVQLEQHATQGWLTMRDDFGMIHADDQTRLLFIALHRHTSAAID